MVETRSSFRELPIVGGDLALDFCNTVDGDPGREGWLDHLSGYRGLVRWSVRVGIFGDGEAERLLGWEGSPEGRAAVERARGLRELLSGIFHSVAGGREPRSEDLRALADAEREVLSDASLAGGAGRGYRWRWPADGGARSPLGPVVHAAVGLLGSGELGRLKGCADCDWLFLDRSKNRSRKWCTMEICGTQAKMRRYVARRAAREAARGRGADAPPGA